MYLKQMRTNVSNKENHNTREFVLSVAVQFVSLASEVFLKKERKKKKKKKKERTASMSLLA